MYNDFRDIGWDRNVSEECPYDADPSAKGRSSFVILTFLTRASISIAKIDESVKQSLKA